MPPFATFAENSEIVRTLQRYGKRVAPLHLIGAFLTFVGNAMLFDIFNRFGKKIFFGNCQATKVQQIDNGWTTEAVLMNSNQPVKYLFKSKNVIFATGSNQFVPKNFIKDY